MIRLRAWLGSVLFYQGEEPFGRRYLRNFISPLFWIFFIGGWYLSHKVSELGVFEYAALHTDDAWMREAAQKRATRSERIRIVNITPEDFKDKQEFEGKLPLSPQQLSRSVCALANRSPEMLIVDLDTSDESYATMPLPQNSKTQIIWARGADASPSDPQVLEPFHVLGGREPPAGHSTGMAVNFLSLDWSVRQYPRWVRTTIRDRSPSLHWKAYCLIRPGDTNCAEDSRRVARELETPSFRRFVEFDRFPIGEFLATSPDSPEETCLSHSIEDRRIAGKIIILGGSYSSCDQFKTPFGDRPGAEIIASALEEEMSRKPSHLMGVEKHVWEILLVLAIHVWEILLVLAILGVHTLLRPVPALLATTGLLALLVWQGVWLAFQVTNYRASVVPFLIAIIIEQMLVAAERAQHLGTEVGILGAKIKEAERNFLRLSEDAAALGEGADQIDVAMAAQDLAGAAKQFAQDAQSGKTA